MAKKTKQKSPAPVSAKEHIRELIAWMSQGVYEKEQIIAVALLCAIAGENIFLLGPPGTAKSMVASRLKMVFKDGKSFDYLMSRFSTPDEIFGPISISRLKNEDRYERLTAGYLPEADVVFLDEIWKAGPSIQNTLLTAINEHIFHNGGQIMRTPMKVLIAASNELPAKDEGLEALWDRFLMRMVSNCIESDSLFFKMIKSKGDELTPLADNLYITQELYSDWQKASKEIGVQDTVVKAIKALRKSLAEFEKNDGNQLRYYVSDRRWRKGYHLMQTSALLNGRSEINLTDYLLLVHCLWNDVECIPNVVSAFTSSIADANVKALNKVERAIKQLLTPPRSDGRNTGAQMQEDTSAFEEFEYFYYAVENYPDGETYFSKWDYTSLSNTPRDGVRYYDSKRKKIIIHTQIQGQPFDAKTQNASMIKRVTLQKCPNGIIINGTPYSFVRKISSSPSLFNSSPAVIGQLPGISFESMVTASHLKVAEIRVTFNNYVAEWEKSVSENWVNCDNIFLSPADLALVNKMLQEMSELIKTTEVKINNIAMMVK